MKYYMVPVAYVVDDDLFVKPEVRVIKAKDPYEALETCKRFIQEDNKFEDPELEVSVWHYQSEDSDEEGYVLGDPVELPIPINQG
jgi:hypothetical protein